MVTSKVASLIPPRSFVELDSIVLTFYFLVDMDVALISFIVNFTSRP